MKKLLVLLTAFAACVSVYGQGKVTFANSAATAITNKVTGAKVAAADVVVGIYYSTKTSGATDADMQFLAPLGTLFSPGLFNAGARTFTGIFGGTPVSLQVRAWSTGFATYEDAMLAPTALEGKSNIFPITLGGLDAAGNTLVTPGITGTGKLQAFLVQPVPEPGMIALAAMGLLGLFLIRRK